MSERGKYIVIEGIDATGKSTQVELLQHWLGRQGIESVQFHEPAGAPIANALREVIKNGSLERDAMTDLMLFTASRRETWRQIGQPALHLGKWAVAARNYFSTEVYQGYADELGIDIVQSMTEQCMPEDYIKPDVTIMLTLADEEERERRIKERGELENPDTFESRDANFQQRLHDGYAAISHIHPMAIVDASVSRQQVAGAIRTIVKPLVEERS